MCPRCGAPLTAGGNCPSLCGGAYAPAMAAAVLDRPVPTEVFTAWMDWKALERLCSTPGPVYCSNCGAPNTAGATYCVNCGKALNP